MKKCPKCQQTKKVHRSHRDAPLWLQVVGWHRFRCTQCNLYFEGFRLFPSSSRNGSSSAKEADEPQIKSEPRPEPKPVAKPQVQRPKTEAAVSNDEGQCLHCQGQ